MTFQWAFGLSMASWGDLASVRKEMLLEKISDWFRLAAVG
jgi:hypothetical protein